MANPVYDAVQDLEKAKLLVGGVETSVENFIRATKTEGSKPPKTAKKTQNILNKILKDLDTVIATLTTVMDEFEDAATEDDPPVPTQLPA